MFWKLNVRSGLAAEKKMHNLVIFLYIVEYLNEKWSSEFSKRRNNFEPLINFKCPSLEQWEM